MYTEGAQFPIGDTCKSDSIEEAMDCCEKSIKKKLDKMAYFWKGFEFKSWSNTGATTIPDAFIHVQPTSCKTMVRAYDYKL
jgi:hypothetical protein